MHTSWSLPWTTVALPSWIIFKQQLVMCLLFSAGYYKFFSRSKPVNHLCSYILQQPAHQRDFLSVYGFMDCSLSGEERERKKGKGGWLLSGHFSRVHKGMRRATKMSLVEISKIWEPTEHMYCVYAFGLTWHGIGQSFPKCASRHDSFCIPRSNPFK